MSPIRILIVDDQAVVRHGLRSMLAGEADIEIVGDVSNSEEAFQMALDTKPDIMLLDIRMPGMDGLHLLSKLTDQLPEIKVIVLTNYEEEQFLLEAFRSGAYSYLLKNVGRETLLEAFRATHAGKRMLSNELMDSVLRQYSDLGKKHGMDKFGLSDDEIALLKLVAAGSTNREIAQQLFWGETAVKRKLSIVFEKLNVTDRAQAIAVAMRAGLI
jgi:DNA-binding NarL/FixJ family response regulator